MTKPAWQPPVDLRSRMISATQRGTNLDPTRDKRLVSDQTFEARQAAARDYAKRRYLEQKVQPSPGEKVVD